MKAFRPLIEIFQRSLCVWVPLNSKWYLIALMEGMPIMQPLALGSLRWVKTTSRQTEPLNWISMTACPLECIELCRPLSSEEWQRKEAWIGIYIYRIQECQWLHKVQIVAWAHVTNGQVLIYYFSKINFFWSCRPEVHVKWYTKLYLDSYWFHGLLAIEALMEPWIAQLFDAVGNGLIRKHAPTGNGNCLWGISGMLLPGKT